MLDNRKKSQWLRLRYCQTRCGVLQGGDWTKNRDDGFSRGVENV